MRSFQKVLKKRGGSRVVAISVLFMLMLWIVVPSSWVASQPKTIAEIALYRGPDREKILIEGAKKEGNLIIYCSNVPVGVEAAKEFEKKYPFIKTSSWRTDSKQIMKRIEEEYKAGRFLVDIIETSHGPMMALSKQGYFQEFYSPEAVYYDDESKGKGKTGVYFLADRESSQALGFNTDLISPAEAPKTFKDLLNPKWKGRMGLSGATSGIRWVGHLMETMGIDFLEKLSLQNVKVLNVSSGAMVSMIVSGEVPLSPNADGPMAYIAYTKGSPIQWRPLDSVDAAIGSSGMTTKAPHPHAALLFLDYIHSQEGQKFVAKLGIISPRKDVAPPSFLGKYKKDYIDSKYPLEVYMEKFDQWENLMNRLFITLK